MNASQKLYYEQVCSDLDIYKVLKEKKKHPCHIPHYLQMLTEKLGKAYGYGEPTPPAKAHTGFRRFIAGLKTKRNLWKSLGFTQAEDFGNYLQEVNSLVYQIERLAPSECGSGPNPEYPWPPPPDLPIRTPVNYDFPLWDHLTKDRRGIKFLAFLEKILKIFPDWF